MKRSRDDVYVSPQVKRPAISPLVEPSGQVHMSTASSMQRLTTTDALSYLKTVKEIFQDKRDKYDEFLDVMKDFKAQRIDTTGVITRVKELFKGYRDLILGFNTFLPKGYEITLPLDDDLRKKPVEFEEAISFVNKIKTRFQGDDHVYKAFLDILNLYRKDNKSITEVYQEVSVLFQNHADLLVEFTHFLPDTSGVVSPAALTRTNHVEKKPAVSYAVGERYNSQPDTEQWNQVEKEKGKREDRDINEWENDDGLDHKKNPARQDGHASDQLHRGMEEMESTFREKVKERLQAAENYEKVSDCICSFKSKFVPAAEFRKLVASLIGEHPDLMEACEDFITYIEKSGSMRTNKQVFRSLKVNEDEDDHDREDKDKTKDNDNRERDRHDRGLAFNSRDLSGQKISYASKDKSMAKPIHELDLSDRESCTPSYRLLPENYPIPSASCRTEIGNQVLNDRWVSVTSGSEDYSFKHMRKNQYEESLFRCEDDRFELDMLLESVNATVKHVEELLDRMNAHTTKADSFNIEECLSALSLRCIERLYGDHGLDVMDVLRKNAPLALPVILTRLKQKQEEWARCRADFNKVWADIYAKNYHKSLDHRSFYFKQQDTKNLSAKALLAEIKEMGDRNQNEDESLLASIAAGYKQPIKPDMVFEYPDPEIQEDLHHLMKYSCGELCAPEQRDKVMKVWTTFLEQVMGVPSHSSSTEDKEVADKENCLVEKSVENIGEVNNNPADGSPGVDNFGNMGAVLYDALEDGKMQIDAKMMSASKQASFLDEGTSISLGVKDIKEEDLSVALKGPDYAVAACGILPTPGPGPLEGIKKHHEESEDCTKTEREEGELSPNPNPEEVNFPLPADNGTKEETIAVADEECEESPRALSDSENVASENADDVSGSDSANGDECSPDANDDESEVEVEGAVKLADRFLGAAAPLAVRLPKGSRGGVECRGLFYGNDSFYLLFRLHQKLYDRMMSAKLHSSSSENRWRISNGANPTDTYAGFKNALRSLLNGSFDNAKFEDECRAIIGAQSYVLFTLDKLIHKLVKQLQTIASEEIDNKLLQLYSYERSRNTKIFSDEVYHVNARFLLPDDNLYRIECLPCPTRLTIQLMRNESDKFEPIAVSMDPEFAAYLNNELLMVVPERMGKPGVYLKRNKMKLYNGDEISDFEKAMEGLVVYNGVEMKVNSVTKKVAYVLGTEDLLYRKKARRRDLYQLQPHGTSNGNSQPIKRRKLLFS
ncbi:Paired amphipathic helix protein Sin3-like 3 [Striga hermonthica]|uniref:Paired amphipathic helix protein Sin3-like 3 n=1 Tax=Striga hermonthica TaxID=68872 RepID=A0A9N7RJZ6_STRHE|nr:Paired amphipathic helix protein Sin3-like 3 [Striga hermonthica]